ncbi:SGNH family hydrolase [Acinetobacter sp. MD2(2019)]|uniref:SGNH/GDSL hydrolase family protein n=1 Tax=Acinetobacter sp. MD2(2019) TaxID=2605273 RepID=UPI002D1ED2FA|nr:SGNH family hydrolase [Acinetobacter sp. MD2(2019)]MEB3753317.1 DUF459 domain-containing protein [Acinetobacter sp. MD2(2019)]
MQTSNQPDVLAQHPDYNDPSELSKLADTNSHWSNFTFAFGLLCCFGLLGIWMMQNSVNAYIQQTYHKASPLSALDQYAYWQEGGKIGDDLYAKYNHVKTQIDDFNSQIVANFNHDYAYTPEYQQLLAKKAQQEKIQLAKEAANRAHQALLNQFSLSKTDQVFFAGDSMMQGVAPYVQKFLQEQYAINTINLSKQSTGLTYPKFFDWPTTIKDTLASNPNIKILVIFLGPNDPWDMYNPADGKVLHFKTPAWEQEYRARIAGIIQNAEQHHVSVIWVTPPNMRKPLLNEQMIYLNQLIADEVKKDKAFFIDARQILQTTNNIYNDYLTQNGNMIKMRSADGTHFSPDGQKRIAQAIESHLNIIN